MIHEYALEPKLVSTWGERENYRLMYGRFGLGTRRIVARFPSYWKKLVFESFRPKQELDRTRLIELLQRFSEIQTTRPGSTYDPAKPWLTNADGENKRIPFYAVWSLEDVDKKLTGFESAVDGLANILVEREAQKMAAFVESFLKLSKSIVFVDPYFNPNRAQYRQSFSAFLRNFGPNHIHAGSLSINIQVAADDPIPWNHYEADCRRVMPRLIPRGCKVTIARWRERPGGEKFHNRYILTDLGGLQFGIGLEAGPNGQTDDLTVLSRDVYVKRWEQYAGPLYAFDVEHTITLHGELI